MDLTVLFNYSILGLIAAILIPFTLELVKREQEARDHAEAEVQRLHELFENQALPLVETTTNAILLAVKYLETQARQREVDDLLAKRDRERNSKGEES
jgi:hypothetical protein